MNKKPLIEGSVEPEPENTGRFQIVALSRGVSLHRVARVDTQTGEVILLDDN